MCGGFGRVEVLKLVTCTCWSYPYARIKWWFLILVVLRFEDCLVNWCKSLNEGMLSWLTHLRWVLHLKRITQTGLVKAHLNTRVISYWGRTVMNLFKWMWECRDNYINHCVHVIFWRWLIHILHNSLRWMSCLTNVIPDGWYTVVIVLLHRNTSYPWRE